MPDHRAARAVLRAATAEVHERLHGARFFDRIAAGTLDIAGYAALLARIRRFHRLTLPARAQALALLGLDPGEASRRLALIEADLGHLDVRRDADLGALPPSGDDAAVGCLYVVEGSALGGKLIHRQLDYLLPGDDGRRFFQGTTEDGARWRRLCDALDRYGLMPGRLPAMIVGAEAAFALFETCLHEEPECSLP